MAKERADALSPARLSNAAAPSQEVAGDGKESAAPKESGNEPPLEATRHTQYRDSGGAVVPPSGGDAKASLPEPPSEVDAKMGGNENDRDSSGKRGAEQASISSDEDQQDDPLSWGKAAGDATSAREIVSAIQEASADNMVEVGKRAVRSNKPEKPGAKKPKAAAAPKN